MMKIIIAKNTSRCSKSAKLKLIVLELDDKAFIPSLKILHHSSDM